MISTAMNSLHSWLIIHGFDPANLNLRGGNGDTALMKAVQAEEAEVVRSLLTAGVDVNARNMDGNNALWFACFRDRMDLIELLLAASVDLNNQNDNGATVLMYAASAGKTDVVKTLLAAGADTTLKNLDDFQAIDFATDREILGLLKHAA